MHCQLKKCPEYKTCLIKKDPFQNGRICKAYRDYINQDIPRRKGSSLEISFTSANVKDHLLQKQIEFSGFSERGKTIIELYFFDRLSVLDIADQLYCSEQYVYQTIKKCKSYLQAFIGKKAKVKNNSMKQKKCTSIKKIKKSKNK